MQRSAIHIGNDISMKEASAPVADAVVAVLAALAAGRHDREVSLKALEVVGMTAGVSGVTISDCMIKGDETHHHHGEADGAE